MAKGSHLFPFRTQKLSPSAPMVLGWTRPGRVGRRRNLFLSSSMAEHSAVNRRVVGSSPTWGAIQKPLKPPRVSAVFIFGSGAFLVLRVLFLAFLFHEYSKSVAKTPHTTMENIRKNIPKLFQSSVTPRYRRCISRSCPFRAQVGRSADWRIVAW